MLNNGGRFDEAAMGELEHNYDELSRIIYRKEKETQFLETKALNLSMFYVASQLFMMFLSGSKSSSPTMCRDSWKPLFFISLSISVAFVLNFGTTVVKYFETKYEQERSRIDREENFHRIVMLKRRGVIEEKHETGLDMPGPDMHHVYRGYTHLGLTVAALSTIAALVLHASRSSTCSPQI